MTAQGFEKSKDGHKHLNGFHWLPPQKPVGAFKRKQPRESTSLPNSSIKARSSRFVLLPQSPLINTTKHNNSQSEKFDLSLTRPSGSPQLAVLGSFSKQLKKSIQDGKKAQGDDRGLKDIDFEDANLDKDVKSMEENGGSFASFRSFLLNFLEEGDCSIKKTLDLYVHQTETGRPVTDAVVQEVCKLRPEMIGLSLRDCTQVTDVGLWCIARHTRALRELNLSGCHNVTNIGLRSLAICCDKMEKLDFSGCTRLTDLSLRVIGGGCWDLKSLSLESCAHVSDSGVAEVAKMCTGLTYLNISHCERVGEHGDRALIQLGKSCHRLRCLDAFGCSHAQDPGILAVARGCPKLEKLMLTGCGTITGKSVRALARGCKALEQLSLSGCGGVGNDDLKELAEGCMGLRHLNIAHCAQVDASGLAALAQGLKNLKELDVAGCERVNDAALYSLRGMNAHSLNLSGCTAVSEAGVASIAKNCTALSTLNVTGCYLVGRAFIAKLCNDIKLAEPAHAFFGFQPRTNVDELLALTEERNRKVFSAVLIQGRMRGCLARRRAKHVKRNWIVTTKFGRAQALVRGYFARKWYRSWRARVREHRASIIIQTIWRMFCGRRTVQQMRKEKVARLRGQNLATKLLAVWRGHKGRVRVREMKALVTRRLLLEAQDQARQELYAIVIQRNWRRVLAQKLLRDLRRIREQMLEQEIKRQAAAVLIQSMARVRREMNTVAAMKAERDRKILEWEMALRVQKAWRGRKARMLVYARWILREQEQHRAAANKIQCFWYVVRARHLTNIQRALVKNRQMQGSAAKVIQRVYRGFKGRLRAKARRIVFKSDCERGAAAIKIQRVFRGHKGRERFECMFHLRSLDDKIRPLQLKLDELSANAAMLSGRLRYLASKVTPLRAEQITFREELFHIRHTKDKYTDSDKINGYRQRFLTKFLRIRLEELQSESVKKLDMIDAEALKLEVKERQNSRLLRQTERELVPFSIGAVQKVKLMRTARLRKKVHAERSASITIQRIFRGWRVRKAVHSWYRDYWIECQDEVTGDAYYINTWTQEARWIKPLEMALFERHEGELSRQDESSNRGDEVSVGSSKFSRHLRKLTEEASHAVEQEAQLLRYVAANRGEEMLEEAREWTFVSTDSRLISSTKCWYRRSTSEYYWGDDPTLCPPTGGISIEEAKVDGDGMTDKRTRLERVTQCGFPDRAAGEAWLKGQNLTKLLDRSERVCNIGPAGWQQRRSFLPPEETSECHALNEAEDSAPLLTAGKTAGIASDETVEGSAIDRRNEKSELLLQEPTVEAVLIDPTVFTFFYHAETGEARWCLSPRTALKSSRSPRREKSWTRLAARSSRSD